MIYLPTEPVPDKYPFSPPTDQRVQDDNTSVILPKTRSWLTDVVYHMRGHETPEAFVLWTSLVMLSSALRRNTWYQHEGNPLFTNLYVLLVGPAGLVKKTTTTEFGQRLLKQYNLQWIKGSGISYKPIKYVEVISDDYTSESVIQRLSRSARKKNLKDEEGKPLEDDKKNLLHYYEDSSCLIVADELSSTLRSKYQRGNLDFLKAVYSNKTVHEHGTKNAGMHTMRNLHTNFIGNTTLDTFTTIPHEVYVDGFMSRMIVVYEFTTDKIIPDAFIPTGTASQEELSKGLTHVTLLHQGAMRPTVEAVQWYEDWYYNKRLEMQDNPDLAGILSRQQLFIRKIATLLAAAEYTDDNDVHLRHFLDADRILRYTYSQNPLTTSSRNDTRDTSSHPSESYLTVYERVSQFLYRNKEKTYSPANLIQALRIRGRYIKIPLINRVLDDLESADKVKLTKKEKKGAGHNGEQTRASVSWKHGVPGTARKA